MRVIAGTAGGRRLRAPDGQSTRPTSDRVREAVFNALDSAGVVVEARVVDLFAGSGALGIEALSRGAAHVHFVDQDPGACRLVEHNLDALGFGGRASVARAALPAAVERMPDDRDLVFADPPYAFDGWVELLDAVADRVTPDAWAVLESDRSLEIGDRWQKMRERTYGGTVIAYVAVIDTGHSSEINHDATGADP